MEPFGLPQSPHFDVAVFNGTTLTAGTGWQTWTKPAGKAMANILVIGGGGGGGSGALGNPSTAGGGGGGGSGSMTIVEIPLDFLPPRLYVSVGAAKTGAGIGTFVSVSTSTYQDHIIANANGGGAGGNASGGTAGAAGAAGAAGNASTMPLGSAFVKLRVAGQAGIAGSGNNNASDLTLPTTGLRVTGGAGGGGLQSSSGKASGGGNFITPSDPTNFPIHLGGKKEQAATVPAPSGSHGYRVDNGPGGYFYYGGTGGASTHPTASGAGLTQGAGGNGGIGSGGGGSGGARTGSLAAPISYGGAGLVVITCY